MWFCGICFVVAVAGAVYGINAFKDIQEVKREEFEKGILKGREQFYYNLPKDSQSFLDNKYPEWRTNQY